MSWTQNVKESCLVPLGLPKIDATVVNWRAYRSYRICVSSFVPVCQCISLLSYYSNLSSGRCSKFYVIPIGGSSRLKAHTDIIFHYLILQHTVLHSPSLDLTRYMCHDQSLFQTPIPLKAGNNVPTLIAGAIGNLETQAFDPRCRGTPPFELRTVGLRGRWKLGDRPAMTALFAVKPTKASPMGATLWEHDSSGDLCCF